MTPATTEAIYPARTVEAYLYRFTDSELIRIAHQVMGIRGRVITLREAVEHIRLTWKPSWVDGAPNNYPENALSQEAQP